MWPWDQGRTIISGWAKSSNCPSPHLHLVTILANHPINLAIYFCFLVNSLLSQDSTNQPYTPYPRYSQYPPTSTTTFSTMLIMKYVLNGCFWVLWRKHCCPAIAPGHPPSKPNVSRVDSGIRLQALRAANLSMP